jgi:integrase
MIGCPALSNRELKLALANLKGRYAFRDRALVILGVRTGLRISELLALKVGQVWNGKTTVARFYVARRATKGKHAGASIVLHPDAAKAVGRWIKAGGLAANSHGYLFPSQKNSTRPHPPKETPRSLNLDSHFGPVTSCPSTRRCPVACTHGMDVK